MQTKTYENLGLRLVLDRSKVVKNDPGADTPAIVETLDGRFTATLACATGEGELDGGRAGFKRLTDAQLTWLVDLELEAEEFLYSEQVA